VRHPNRSQGDISLAPTGWNWRNPRVIRRWQEISGTHPSMAVGFVSIRQRSDTDREEIFNRAADSSTSLEVGRPRCCSIISADNYLRATWSKDMRGDSSPRHLSDRAPQDLSRPIAPSQWRGPSISVGP